MRGQRWISRYEPMTNLREVSVRLTATASLSTATSVSRAVVDCSDRTHQQRVVIDVTNRRCSVGVGLLGAQLMDGIDEGEWYRTQPSALCELTSTRRGVGGGSEASQE